MRPQPVLHPPLGEVGGLLLGADEPERVDVPPEDVVDPAAVTRVPVHVPTLADALAPS